MDRSGAAEEVEEHNTKEEEEEEEHSPAELERMCEEIKYHQDRVMNTKTEHKREKHMAAAAVRSERLQPEYLQRLSCFRLFLRCLLTNFLVFINFLFSLQRLYKEYPFHYGFGALFCRNAICVLMYETCFAKNSRKIEEKSWKNGMYGWNQKKWTDLLQIFREVRGRGVRGDSRWEIRETLPEYHHSREPRIDPELDWRLKDHFRNFRVTEDLVDGYIYNMWLAPIRRRLQKQILLGGTGGEPKVCCKEVEILLYVSLHFPVYAYFLQSLSILTISMLVPPAFNSF